MKWYVLVIFLIMGLSVAGLLTISFNFNPYQSGIQVKYLFFASLFMVLWGFSTLALNRFKLKMDWPDFYKSFKIGLIISLAGCLLIFIVRHVRY
ncbi:MAG: hypothetical protein A3I26_01380 [Candidatus Yanofskybacteria bacterium RIFCSPLOWO2_02_FULL_43_10]|nr:MAG: hypothetical protein A3C69_02320 [Candidatus Yanofskybacteria bacterium RIFCSPHIGHO2_02_FULL_43_12]OGN28421.1 MAG: hypothetical protein A3I26_01380 [Candidatus Yanofskybacteria bacterium RIFCSPLOWO2_02_FULL_43_10]